MQAAEAGVQKAELNLSYTEIHTPIAGIIDRAAYDVGNLVGPSSGVLATVNSLDPITATFSISEALYLKDPEGMVESYREVLIINSDHAAGHYYMAVGLLALKETEQARDHASRAIALGYQPRPEFMREISRAETRMMAEQAAKAEQATNDGDCSPGSTAE